MALRDYITCQVCEKKLIYDGHDNARDELEDRFGDPDAPDWTVKVTCGVCLGDPRVAFTAFMPEDTSENCTR